MGFSSRFCPRHFVHELQAVTVLDEAALNAVYNEPLTLYPVSNMPCARFPYLTLATRPAPG